MLQQMKNGIFDDVLQGDIVFVGDSKPWYGRLLKSSLVNLLVTNSALQHKWLFAMSVVTLLGWYVGGTVGAYPEQWLPENGNFFVFSLMFSISVPLVFNTPYSFHFSRAGQGTDTQINSKWRGKWC
ncbi:hypothetical protein LINPERHAP2_LOCUS7495 [Linum perenne]